MRYLSPFHILPKGFENKAVLDKRTLKQARKVLLAEFELQGQTTIFINEQEYDKDAILKFFDKLEKDTHLEFHTLIFQNKSLLRFLEHGQIEDYEVAAAFIAANDYPNPEQFQQFIAPYFVTNYNNLLYKSLRTNNKNELFPLVNVAFPLSSEYEPSAYQSSYRWYHQQLRQVEKIEKALEEDQFVPSRQIYELIDPAFIHNFNQLPDYFFDIRDKYAFKLYELIVLLNNTHKRIELARTVLDAGMLLKVDDFTHEYYINADKIIEKKAKQKSRPNWLWIYLVAQVIFILFRIATCNNSSTPSYEYNFNHISPNRYVPSLIDSNLTTPQQHSINNLEKLDSMIQALEKISPTIDTTPRKSLIDEQLLNDMRLESKTLDSILKDLQKRILLDTISNDSTVLINNN